MSQEILTKTDMFARVQSGGGYYTTLNSRQLRRYMNKKMKKANNENHPSFIRQLIIDNNLF